MSDYIKREDVEGLFEKYHPYMATRVLEYADKLHQLPAADVEPVRHGYWDKDMECSKCGELAPISEVTGERYKWDYCPNCGAKMDGDKG